MVCSIRLILLGLLCGCVSQGKFDELKKKYDDAQAEIGARDQRIGTLEGAVAQGEAQVQRLQTLIDEATRQNEMLVKRLEDKDRELTALEGDNAKASDELAKLIKDRSALKESTARLQQALLELNKRKAEADKRVAELKGLMAKFKGLIDAGKLRVKMVDGRMVLVLPTDILFDSGSAKLATEGKQAIAEVAAVLATMADKRFQVEGHTDNVPIRTAQYPSNWELSQARALVVVKAMTEAGVKGAALSAAGYGEHHPTAPNDTEKGKAENRRIEIVVVPDLSMLPGFDELQRIVDQG
jgi:chemotaxis protein MotB